MSTERVHFFGIIGRPADDVEAACRRIMARRRPPPADEVRPVDAVWHDDWLPRDRDRIDRLCDALLSRPHRLPVLHHSQFLDAYAMGGHLLSVVAEPDAPPQRAYALNRGFAFYESGKVETWRREIRRLQRSFRGSRSSAAGWYADHLRDAIDSMAHWKDTFLVVAVTECLGYSRMDTDVRAAAAGRFDWRPKRPSPSGVSGPSDA